MLYLFDIDGTILLTGGAGTRALNAVFRDRYGVDDAMDHVRPGGKTDPLIVTEIFENRVGRTPSAGEIDEVLDAYVPLLVSEIATSPGFRLMPRVVEALDFLARQEDITLGLATGNIRAGARAKLERPALWERFAVGGFGSDDAVRAGLVARAIERGCAHAGRKFSPEEVVVVGDTPRDVEAAHACGARAVVAATGAHDRDALAASGADAVFDTLADLPAWHREGLRSTHSPR